MNTDPNRNRAARELAEGERPIVASRSPLSPAVPRLRLGLSARRRWAEKCVTGATTEVRVVAFQYCFPTEYRYTLLSWSVLWLQRSVLP